jgi:ribosome recycling factor
VDVDEVLLDAAERMDKAVDALRQSLATVRTGRANTALVEHLQVTHYDQTMPLNQLATLAAPDPTLITVQPWDKGAMQPIMKAIQASDLGITPSSDGAVIRLPIPPLTEERRRDLVKQVHGSRSCASRCATAICRRTTSGAHCPTSRS